MYFLLVCEAEGIAQVMSGGETISGEIFTSARAVWNLVCMPFVGLLMGVEKYAYWDQSGGPLCWSNAPMAFVLIITPV